MKTGKNSSFSTIVVCLAVFAISGISTQQACADYIKMNPPPDVDKVDHNHWYDGNYKPTCWVATAANMLAGGGYGDGNNVQERADEIYDEMCNDILDCNQCGWTDTALSAWLNSADNKWKNTNPYKNITVLGESNWKNTRNPWLRPDLPEFLGNQLRNGATAQLSIDNVSKTIGHSITAWGDDDNDTESISENPTKVKVTDSDYPVFTQHVQTYTYDDYNNPNPGGGNQGVGWYFNYGYSNDHRYIDDITFLSSCPIGFNLSGTWGLTIQYVGSYKIHQDNQPFAALGLRYKVNSDKMFYGPKIDMHIRDTLGRYWQCGTVQVDLNLPGRLGAFYIGPDGEKHSPVIPIPAEGIAILPEAQDILPDAAWPKIVTLDDVSAKLPSATGIDMTNPGSRMLLAPIVEALRMRRKTLADLAAMDGPQEKIGAPGADFTVSIYITKSIVV